MSSRIVVTAAVLLAGGLLAGGCSTGGGGGQTASDDKGAGGRAAERLSGKGGGAKVTLAPRDRSVVYTARLTVRVNGAAKARREATSIVTKAHGYTARERTRKATDGGGNATSRLTLKVPVGQYPAVLHELSTKLGNRLSLKQRAHDVTAKVADVDSRVRSARATIDQLRALVRKADTVGEVLKVEKRLSKREANLEALEARQRALDTKTSYATITLRLKTPAATHVQEAGFVSGLAAGWAALRATVVWLLTALGAIAPFVLIMGAIAYGSWRGYRILRRRRPFADR